MAIVSVFFGTRCRGEEIVAGVAGALGSRVVDDRALSALAAKRSGAAEGKFIRTLSGGVSLFENFNHERERNIAWLRMALSDVMREENLLLSGACGHLVPREISHCLRVCVIADMEHRIEQAVREAGVSRREAQRLIEKEDEGRIEWARHLLGKDPWDASLYDILIPTHKTSVPEAVALVLAHASDAPLRPTARSREAVADFGLSARVEMELGKAGHNVTVSARGSHVILTINRHALMLSKLEDELREAALKVAGVKTVETKVGPGFYQAGVYRRLDAELPEKVLLVDDEREFVQTLSERLLMRDLGSAVVYDGEEALSFVAEEEPEVVVLDLKMPGIDGIEVLRRLKAEHPGVEVIILTGHGSRKDEETCMALGAFAYLQKPVDIERLSECMRAAYRQIRGRASEEERP